MSIEKEERLTLDHTRMTRKQAEVCVGLLDVMGIGADICVDDNLKQYTDDGDEVPAQPGDPVWIVEIPSWYGYRYIHDCPQGFDEDWHISVYALND